MSIYQTKDRTKADREKFEAPKTLFRILQLSVDWLDKALHGMGKNSRPDEKWKSLNRDRSKAAAAAAVISAALTFRNWTSFRD